MFYTKIRNIAYADNRDVKFITLNSIVSSVSLQYVKDYLGIYANYYLKPTTNPIIRLKFFPIKMVDESEMNVKCWPSHRYINSIFVTNYQKIQTTS